MKKISFFIILLLVSGSLYAEKYVFEDSEGIHVMTLADPSTTVEAELAKIGKPGVAAVLLLGGEPKENQKYWRLQGSRITVDTAKKQADEAAQAVKEERKRALLKLTPTEYQEAKDLGLIR